MTTEGYLFSDRGNHEPLAAKLAPSRMDEFHGQEEHLGKNGALRKLIENDALPSCVFFGPPGCGKTALARIVARRTESLFLRLNAVTARIDDLRGALKKAEQNRNTGKRTIIFIDEIHRFNKMVQDGLLPALEQGLAVMIGTTTKNPYYYLIPPLRSRVLLFEFRPLSEQNLRAILQRAAEQESVTTEPEAADHLVKRMGGDARRMLNILEAAAAIGQGPVSLQAVSQVLQKQGVQYDRDEDYHYDVISAFIKSIRGSDPDAALYWLVSMLEGGEDPLFIARRLVILASEDVGLADPLSLIVADAAYSAVDRVGMPEARIILSHAAVYLSLQPKSNSAYQALSRAEEFLKARGSLPVPDHLRSAHPSSGRYVYPHDHPYHWVAQGYLPEQGRSEASFYVPGELGAEKELKKRLLFLRRLAEQHRRDEET